jgi:predicted RNA-binding Zn-ribbon protein involved in translation (DUF1610 family)
MYIWVKLMGIDLRPTCSKCGKVIDLADMRAMGDGKFSCKSCFENKAPTFNPLNREKPPEFEHPKVKPVDHAAIEPIASEESFFAQKEYVCGACGYVFKRSPTKAVKQCPFCGKDEVHQKVDDYAGDYVQ